MPADFLHARFVTASAHYRCDSCERAIKPGEPYRYTWGRSTDTCPQLRTGHECAACCKRYGRWIPGLTR